MKKIILFFAPFAIAAFAGCGTYDDKNKVEQYPTTDTTQMPEKKNDPFADSTNKSHPTEKSID